MAFSAISGSLIRRLALIEDWPTGVNECYRDLSTAIGSESLADVKEVANAHDYRHKEPYGYGHERGT